jgi:hypothetical protein
MKTHGRSPMAPSNNLPSQPLGSDHRRKSGRGHEMYVSGIHLTHMHTYTDPDDVLPLELCRFRCGYRRGVKRDERN